MSEHLLATELRTTLDRRCGWGSAAHQTRGAEVRTNNVQPSTCSIRCSRAVGKRGVPIFVGLRVWEPHTSCMLRCRSAHGVQVTLDDGGLKELKGACRLGGKCAIGLREVSGTRKHCGSSAGDVFYAQCCGLWRGIAMLQSLAGAMLQSGNILWIPRIALAQHNPQSSLCCTNTQRTRMGYNSEVSSRYTPRLSARPYHPLRASLSFAVTIIQMSTPPKKQTPPTV